MGKSKEIDIKLDSEKVLDNKDTFAQEFRKIITAELDKNIEQLTKSKKDDWYSLVLGDGSIPTGRKTKMVNYILSLVMLFPIARFLPFAIFVFSSLIIKGVQEVVFRLGYHYFRKKELNKYEDKLPKEKADREIIITSVAQEITRIFEFQIGALKDEAEVKKLAKYASKRILDALINSALGLKFTRNDLLTGLLFEPQNSIIGFIKKIIFYISFTKLETVIKVEKKGVIKWNLDDIFTKPGLRWEEKNKSESEPGYKLYAQESSNPKIYGYRNRIMRRADDGKTFADHDIDNKIKQQVKEFNYVTKESYLPLTRIVNFEDVEQYMESLKESKDAFKDSISKRYGQAIYQLFYRDEKLVTELGKLQGDFSCTDFGGTCFNAVKEKHNLRELNDFFERRKTETILAQQFIEHKHLAVTGITGCGKTDLVKNFLYKLLKKETNTIIWCFDATDIKTLKRDYSEFATNIGVSEIDSKVLPSIVEERLLGNPEIKEVVLFFDNAKQETDINPYIPFNLNNCKVIVTSEDENFFLDSRLNLSIGSLTQDEAKEFITDNKFEELSLENKKACISLVENVRLPRTLVIIRDSIKENPSIVAYASSIASENATDIEKRIISLAMDQLGVGSPAYKMFLQSIFLYTNNIPLLLLINSDQDRTVEIEQFKIHKRSLARIDGEKDNRTVHVHEFIQKLVISLLTRQDKQAILEKLLAKMVRYFVKDKDLLSESAELFSQSYFKSGTKSTFELNRLLLPHVEKLLEHIKFSDMTLSIVAQINRIKLYNTLGYLYSQMGPDYIKKSEECLRLAKDEFEKIITDLKESDTLPEVVCARIIEFTERNAYALKEIYSMLPKGSDLNIDLFQRSYLIELYISILYSLGRTYFYDNKTFACQKADFKGYIEFGFNLSKLVDNKLSIKLFHQVLCQRNGLLYFQLEETDTAELISARKTYMDLLSDSNQYYSEGQKFSLENDDQHKAVCLRQIINCSIKLNNFDGIEQYLESLNKKLEKQGTKIPNIGSFYNMIGNALLQTVSKNDELGREEASEQPLHYDRTTEDILNKAKSYFLRAYSSEHLQDQLNYPLFDAMLGLAEVHFKLKNITLSSLFLQRLGAVANKFPDRKEKLIELHTRIYPNKSIQKWTSLLKKIKTRDIQLSL